MLYPSLLTGVLLATSVEGLSRRSVYSLKEEHPVPFGWRRSATEPEDHPIDLHIGLKQGNFAELERHLYEVSDPDHSRYGQHLSHEHVQDLVRPSDKTAELVEEWLEDNDIATYEYNPSRDWIRVVLPMSAVESLLETKYSIYEHEDGASVVRAPAWSLPSHLHGHIDTIQPTNSFFRARKQAMKVRPIEEVGGLSDAVIDELSAQTLEIESDNGAAAPKACNDSAVTPKCLRSYYGTINYKPQVPGKNQVALCNYLNETNKRTDVNLFINRFRPAATGYGDKFPIIRIRNGDDTQTPYTPAQLAARKNIEGNLDAETIIGIGYPTPLTAYNTGGSPPFLPANSTPTNTNEPYLAWQNYLLGQQNIPQVISTSYDDDEQTVPPSYANRVCSQFAQFGAKGITVLFASGDYGVGQNNSCVSTKTGKPMFLPEFPSTCPYVTSVGGTKNFDPEVAAFDPRNGYHSGGGFSNYFPAPQYQRKVVNAYIKSQGTKYNGLYNKTGRGYPDIAAAGQSFVVAWNGTFILVDGTSAATPAAAGILTLVNDALIAKGKPTLGFLNPWLYSTGYQAFNDITSGFAAGCNVDGFPAQAGWDAVTGWGSPMFGRITQALGI